MLNTSFLNSSKLSACFGALLFGKEEIGDPLAPLGTPTLQNKMCSIRHEAEAKNIRNVSVMRFVSESRQ